VVTIPEWFTSAVPPDLETGLVNLVDVLELKALQHNRFQSIPAFGLGPKHSIFGGQTLAQALRAASLTVPEGRVAHSLHAYFLTPGVATEPIEFEVDSDRDGGRYSIRRVVAVQNDSALFSMSCSFSLPREGTRFQAVDMPPAQSPDLLQDTDAIVSRVFDLVGRVPDHLDSWSIWPSRMWVRIVEPLGDDPNVRACAVAFLSDLSTGLARIPEIEKIGGGISLDHSLWLHGAANPNDWMLIDLDPLVADSGRAVYNGRIFDSHGVQQASLMQESLIDIAARMPRR
jgi:acyl-CoA thioesterase-2